MKSEYCPKARNIICGVVQVEVWQSAAKPFSYATGGALEMNLPVVINIAIGLILFT